ncbi:MAG: hypothetical protein LUD39_04615, partial [Opitutae bacterium]|nr:hypothetical protein [Opitutae bacterium]
MNDEKKDAPGSPEEVDLSSLSALDFNPDWASDGAKKISLERASGNDERRDSRRDRDARPRGKMRDRNRENFQKKSDKGDSPKAFSRERDNDRGRERNRRDRRHGQRDSKGDSRRAGGEPAFEPKFSFPPVADIAIYPENKRFAVLAKAVKNSARTYVLFDLARIILEKPERFVVVISQPHKKDKAGNPLPLDKPAAPFFVSVPDGMPFLNESDAVAYVFKNHIDKFFTVEEVELDPPKGNFTMIAKCGFTGELLAPPNYHAYQQILRDHHAANFPRMSFEKFTSRIETVKDPEAINAWLEKKKKVTRYVIKDRAESEPEYLESESAVKNFLATNRKEQVVKETPSARFLGTLVEPMPMGPLRSAILREVQFQQKFPLNTANNLRGKLRQLGFSLYRQRQSKITLVCGVKRKSRTQGSVFSDTIQRIFDFLEKNPGTLLADLPAKMLGIEPKPATKPDAATKEAAAKADATTNPGATTNPDAATNPPAEKTLSLAEEFQAKELVGTTRWLVNEGYVTEMSDGKLYVQPVISEAQARAAAKSEQPIERPEIKTEEGFEDKIADVVPAAPAPMIKVIGSLSAAPEESPEPATEAEAATDTVATTAGS